MGLGLLLIPALGGYLFLTNFNLTRDRAVREGGYHIVFGAAIAGIVLFIVARGIVSVVGLFPYIGDLWKLIVPIEYSGTAAVSVGIGWLAPKVLNRFSRYNRRSARRRAAREDGDQISLVIDEAQRLGSLVEVSLTNDKCYIGAPLTSTFGKRDTGDIAIVPVASGYRHKETRDLKITVYYAQALKELVDRGQDLNTLRVAVPLQEIVSARLFNPGTYVTFEKAIRNP